MEGLYLRIIPIGYYRSRQLTAQVLLYLILGLGLGPMLQCTGPVEITTCVKLLTNVIISTGLVTGALDPSYTLNIGMPNRWTRIRINIFHLHTMGKNVPCIHLSISSVMFILVNRLCNHLAHLNKIFVNLNERLASNISKMFYYTLCCAKAPPNSTPTPTLIVKNNYGLRKISKQIQNEGNQKENRQLHQHQGFT